MQLIDQVVKLLRELDERRWASTFAAHGVTLADVRTEGDLRAERAAIDRKRPGFEDLAPACRSLIEPGDPALSLLYHALAHPGVHPTADGRPGADARFYASAEELDLVENTIYAMASPPAAARQGLRAAVFAYQYREAARTPHGKHADLVFSRLGVARVGDQEACFDRATRGWTQRGARAGGIRVSPARFGVFLARVESGAEVEPLGGRVRRDRRRAFLVPVHKVFEGPECVAGASLALTWSARHRDEKLGRAVTHGRLRLHRDLDPARAPFVRESEAGGGLALLTSLGSTVALAPPPKPLVEPARQVTPQGETRYARVRVPPAFWPVPLVNRRYTTLHLLGNLLRAGLDALLFLLQRRRAFFMPRRAPEFVNIRHEVLERGGEEHIVNLGKALPRAEDFEAKVRRGGYWALLFEDGLCEGCVSATITGLEAGPVQARPAWSIVAAPDFFPQADQAELALWLERERRPLGSAFGNGGPAPLCRGRLPINPALRLPGEEGARAFGRHDQTVVAIVTRARGGVAAPTPLQGPPPERAANFLSDAAADVFAPGWDCTYDGLGFHSFYATYGLGSPYPEDVKLCAAGGGSWPATSPDASRTYRRLDAPTAIPLTDTELGLHAKHRLVRANSAARAPGWDGEHGPFLERKAGRLLVNYADIERSDYVANAKNGLLRPELLAGLGTSKLIARMEQLRLCIAELDARRSVGTTRLWLIELSEVIDWQAESDRPDASWAGPGYRWVFASVAPSGFERDGDDFRRRCVAPERLWGCATRAGAVHVRDGHLVDAAVP